MTIDNANLQIDEYEKHFTASYWLRAASELFWFYSWEELCQMQSKTFADWKKAYQILLEAGLEPILADEYLPLLNPSQA